MSCNLINTLKRSTRRVKANLYSGQNVELPVIELFQKDLPALWEEGAAPAVKHYAAWAEFRFLVADAILQCGFDAFVLGQCDAFYYEPDSLDLSDISQELLRRLCEYLPAQTGREQAIPCLRWGICGPVVILQDIADRIGQKRERVRQLQVEAEKEFALGLRIPVSVIAQRIAGIPSERLVQDLPSLRAVFITEAVFRRFVEAVIGDPGGIPVTDCRILENFFATHGQPIHRHQVGQHTG